MIIWKHHDVKQKNPIPKGYTRNAFSKPLQENLLHEHLNEMRVFLRYLFLLQMLVSISTLDWFTKVYVVQKKNYRW